ncbi:hypothetical protein N658DRAFT_425860 [Parathielavia hyrcaniae]|uniref:Uncharacterized protein n=1 Tax=Parathielavia hyrcaniae TaxID=113614 RepID=A0AAN6T189_9PEZI|nr:hypothetical protein N658DRAFT_425860 [Parathielavia hyrcaniae]
MPSLHCTAVSTLACLGILVQLVSAATEVKLLSGVCEDYPGAFQSNTGNAYAPEANLVPLTGTYIDSLDSRFRFGSILEHQRFRLPWYSLALYNETGHLGYRVGCRDEDGLAVLGTESHSLRINTNQGGTLVFNGSYGLTPEPYAYYVDGARQPGVYLGAAGEVRWAWSQVAAEGIVYWRPRLMVATVERPAAADLAAGEVQGFLAVKPWP